MTSTSGLLLLLALCLAAVVGVLAVGGWGLRHRVTDLSREVGRLRAALGPPGQAAPGAPGGPDSARDRAGHGVGDESSRKAPPALQ